MSINYYSIQDLLVVYYMCGYILIRSRYFNREQVCIEMLQHDLMTWVIFSPQEITEMHSSWFTLGLSAWSVCLVVFMCPSQIKYIVLMAQVVVSPFQCGSMAIALRHRHHSIWDDSLGKNKVRKVIQNRNTLDSHSEALSWE